jgi:preprotein translocase subunit SecF
VKKTVLIAVVFVVGFILMVVFTTFHGKRERVEVCMEFKGGRDCRTASAANRQEAQRTAVTNACAQLSSGVIETNQCETTPPESVTWLQ